MPYDTENGLKTDYCIMMMIIFCPPPKKKTKKTGDPDTKNKNIQQVYKNGSWYADYKKLGKDLVLFYGLSTLVGYLMPHLVFIYIYIYKN